MLPDFLSSIAATVTEALENAMQEFGAENLTGFALYTDESAMTLSVTINTATHLHQCWDENPEYKMDYWWSPAEWVQEMFASPGIETVSAELSRYHAIEKTQQAFLTLRDEFFETCVTALEKAKPLIPTDIHPDFIRMLSVSDYFPPEHLGIPWIERLNDTVKAESYAEWVRSFN